MESLCAKRRLILSECVKFSGQFPAIFSKSSTPGGAAP